VGQRGSTGITKNNSGYIEFHNVSFGLIFVYEFVYTVGYSRINIYFDWIAKDSGIMIV